MSVRLYMIVSVLAL